MERQPWPSGVPDMMANTVMTNEKQMHCTPVRKSPLARRYYEAGDLARAFQMLILLFRSVCLQWVVAGVDHLP